MQFHTNQLQWVLKSTDWYFFLSFSWNWGGSIFPLCTKSSLQCSRLVFHRHSPSWQWKGQITSDCAVLFPLRSQPMPLVVQIPPFAVLLHKDFLLCMTFIGVFIWTPAMCVGEREEHITLSLPHLSCPAPATASPWYPLPLQPTQTEILRLIMASADKMKKAIKCVQRGTLWSFSNIPLPLILSTVNTLMTQTTWPRGCKAGRAPSL